MKIYWDAPDDKSDLGVRAEISGRGNSSSPENFLETLTLTHQTTSGVDGRYSVLYTPPPNHDYLSVKYLIYTDTGVATRDGFTYGTPSEDIVLNSGVGQLGGGGGGVVVKPMTDKEITKVAKKLWQVPLSDIDKEDSAAIWLKTRSDFDSEDIEQPLQDINKEIIGIGSTQKISDNNVSGVMKELSDIVSKVIVKVDTSKVEILENVDKKTEENIKAIDSINSKMGEMKDGVSIETAKSQLMSSLFLIDAMSMVDKKIDDFVVNQKIPKVNDLAVVLETIRSESDVANTRQSQIFTDFMQNKFIEMIKEIENETSDRTVNQLVTFSAQNFKAGSEQAKNMSKMVEELKKQSKENDKKLNVIQKENKLKMSELMSSTANNATALLQTLVNQGKLSEKDKSNFQNRLRTLTSNFQRT